MPAPSIVILGGGVMGASVAYHLAARGARDILVIDRAGAPGGGSTSRATGGFRAQYATPINVRLSLLAREKLRRFREEIGGECGYEPFGYLWLAMSERELAILDEAREMQRAVGLHEAQPVTPDEIASSTPPSLSTASSAARSARPMASSIRWAFLKAICPRRRVSACASSGRGGDVGGSRCREPRRRGHDAGGHYSSRCGRERRRAWAGDFACSCGVDTPVVPLRRQVARIVRTHALPASMPMTIFAADGFHTRVRDGRVLLLWPTPGVPGHPFDDSLDTAWVSQVTAMAHERLPVLRDVPVDAAASWAGLYEMSPDKHAILGAAPGCDNFYLVNGSSGHGVMHAPALGQLLAEIILDARPAPRRPRAEAGTVSRERPEPDFGVVVGR